MYLISYNDNKLGVMEKYEIRAYVYRLKIVRQLIQ